MQRSYKIVMLGALMCASAPLQAMKGTARERQAELNDLSAKLNTFSSNRTEANRQTAAAFFTNLKSKYGGSGGTWNSMVERLKRAGLDEATLNRAIVAAPAGAPAAGAGAPPPIPAWIPTPGPTDEDKRAAAKLKADIEAHRAANIAKRRAEGAAAAVLVPFGAITELSDRFDAWQRSRNAANQKRLLDALIDAEGIEANLDQIQLDVLNDIRQSMITEGLIMSTDMRDAYDAINADLADIIRNAPGQRSNQLLDTKGAIEKAIADVKLRFPIATYHAAIDRNSRDALATLERYIKTAQAAEGVAAEAIRAAEAKRVADAKRATDEAKRAADEAKRVEDAKRAADEAKLRAEQAERERFERERKAKEGQGGGAAGAQTPEQQYVAAEAAFGAGTLTDADKPRLRALMAQLPPARQAALQGIIDLI